MRGILNLHPAYTSILVDFDPRLRSHAQVEALLRERIATQADKAPPEPRHVEIPVRYGGEFGPDLKDVARHTGLSEERVVELHAAAEYLVYFVGFSTCFPYSGRPAARIGHAAPGSAAQTCAGGERRHWRSAGGHLSAGLAWRLAADRPDRIEAFRPFRLAAAAAAHGRPGALRSGCGRRRFEPHSRAGTGPADHGAGPGPLRVRAFRNLGFGRGGPAGIARGQSAGGQCGECRRAGDDADGRRVRLRGRAR